MGLSSALIIGTAGAALSGLAKGFGCDVGQTFAGTFLTEFGAKIGELLPAWVHEQMLRKPGEPNHDLAVAFHSALQNQIVYVSDGSLQKAFAKAQPESWNTLHTPTKQAIEAWFKNLRLAAKDSTVAGSEPVVPLDDQTLKALLEESGSDSPSRTEIAKALRADLEAKLAGTHSGADQQVNDAVNAFLDWLTGHLSAQFQIFFLEEMKKSGSRAWIAYQYLVAQSLQKGQEALLKEAGITRQKVEELIILLKQGYEQGTDAFAEKQDELLHEVRQNQQSLDLHFRTAIDLLKQLHEKSDKYHQVNLAQHKITQLEVNSLSSGIDEIKAMLAAQGKTVKDISQQEIEEELASRLDCTVTELRQIIAAGLTSSDLSQRAIALMANGDYLEAERVSTQAAEEKRKKQEQLTESLIEDISRAGDACYFRGDDREALPHYDEALSYARKDRFPVLWAKLQHDRGLALRQLSTRTIPSEGNRFLGEAIAAYRSALEVRTRESLPQGWAMTQNNLANALSDQALRLEGDASVERLGEAIAAYHAALEVHTRETLPQDWAMTQNNLANALSDQAVRLEGDASVERLGEAIAAYRAALEVRTRETLPQDWAMTQNNLANALRNQAMRLEGDASVERLGEAIAACRAALEVRTRESLPQGWALTQNNLASALRNQAMRLEGDASVERLGEAIAVYRKALEVCTRESLPQYWALTQNNLANALRDQGMRLEGDASVERLGEAIVAYRAALEVYTRETSPQDWATTQNNLASALRNQAMRLEGDASVGRLGEAIAAYRAALEVRTRESLPQGWAMTQSNLANALRDQAMRLEGDASVERLGEAIAACRAALEVRTRESLPQSWAMTQSNLANAMEDLGDILQGADQIKQWQEAEKAYLLSLQVLTDVTFPYHHKIISQSLERVRAKLKQLQEPSP